MVGLPWLVLALGLADEAFPPVTRLKRLDPHPLLCHQPQLLPQHPHRWGSEGAGKPGLVTISILSGWLVTIKDKLLKCGVFLQTHNQGLRKLCLTEFWDVRALQNTPDLVPCASSEATHGARLRALEGRHVCSKSLSRV